MQALLRRIDQCRPLVPRPRPTLVGNSLVLAIVSALLGVYVQCEGPVLRRVETLLAI